MRPKLISKGRAKVDNNSLKRIKRYQQVFDELVGPWIEKERNVHLQAINHRFIDDLLCAYLGNMINAPTVGKVLGEILNMPNLHILELMSDLRDIRHDTEDMTTIRHRGNGL
ncbi:MAG: hypothetical protein V3U54_08780 [Thermodesulfobacteriota bacterium]